jgi:diguanylate cyclase (GGDEF)-like protein
VGDAILQRAGEVLLKASDKHVHAARIGGDEFALLMPGVDEHSGAIMLDSIRKLVDLNNQFYTGPTLSLSMGIATCRKGSELSDALRRADMAMYDNKREFYETGDHNRRRP